MADLALLVGPGDVITLSGDLGAGKTAAARAMIRYLADDDALEVPSPTFTLAQIYDQPFPIVHADLYRINDASELEEIGLSPLPEGTLALIEWPERAPDALPHDRIDIAFSHRPALGSNARAAEFTGYGKGAALVERLHALRQFLDPCRTFGRAARAHARRRLDPFLCAADATTAYGDPDEFAANGRMARRSMMENPTAPPCISPRTSNRSSPSTMACASAASRRRRSITPISTTDF